MRLFWEQVALPVQALIGNADVIFSPANVAVLGAPVPQVLMFQNLVPFAPEVIRRRRESAKFRFFVLRAFGILSSRLARRVVFIANAQREAILPWLGVAASKTATVYLGHDPAFSPRAIAAAPGLLRRLGLTQPYLLSVSQVYHYKNLVELVRAFARATTRLPSDVKLALAGAEHERRYAALVRRTIRDAGLGDRVKVLGHVPYHDLPPLYAAASQFVFPSTCESFPNILIEALASGVPVLSSRCCSMPELAGDAAVYFDPFDPEEMGRQIVTVWEDAALARSLSEKGIARAERYSWDRTAVKILELLETAAFRAT